MDGRKCACDWRKGNVQVSPCQACFRAKYPCGKKRLARSVDGSEPICHECYHVCDDGDTWAIPMKRECPACHKMHIWPTEDELCWKCEGIIFSREQS